MRSTIFTLCFVLLTVLTFSGVSLAQNIAGSDHDFSSASWNSSSAICIVCHTPHNANISVSNAPLWNHQVTTATFTLYNSATMDATTGQPDASSKLCLSCHDGTVAMDNFSGETGGTHFISGGADLDTELSDDHPISFTYDASLASTDGGLKDPATASSGLGSTIANDLLIGGQVQCASCHDVHNSSGTAHLLIKSNAGSALCLTCHEK